MARVIINKYIVADSNICHGTPTFKGTRIMVWQVLEMLAGGETVEELLQDFPSLRREHIGAALEYAAGRIEGERFFPARERAKHYATAR